MCDLCLFKNLTCSFPHPQTDYSEDSADTKPDRDIELELSALDADEPDGQVEQMEVWKPFMLLNFA